MPDPQELRGFGTLSIGTIQYAGIEYRIFVGEIDGREQAIGVIAGADEALWEAFNLSGKLYPKAIQFFGRGSLLSSRKKGPVGLVATAASSGFDGLEFFCYGLHRPAGLRNLPCASRSCCWCPYW